MNQQQKDAALTFAAENHPELAELLGQLKTDNPREYRRALRQISQARERLARLKTRAPERYDLALDAWKLDSRKIQKPLGGGFEAVCYGLNGRSLYVTREGASAWWWEIPAED